ncbi:MAG: beta-N-acetylhexosaminidase [Gammaproteobacteria bacterium]|nr:beta-N-acetylhexosaminidase [Gammaproteobacteria bacterium]
MPLKLAKVIFCVRFRLTFIINQKHRNNLLMTQICRGDPLLALPLGPLIVDIAGLRLTNSDREILQHPLVGGIILFSRNYQSRTQLIELTTQIKQLRSPELLIAVDHEGGRVQRFQTEFIRLPPIEEFGALYETDPAAALTAAQMSAYTMASELRSSGVDLSFAPVIDLNKKINNALVGGRAIHPDPDIVIAVARAYIAGMHQAGMSATAKHFPGHGSITVDPHVGIPRDPRHFADIENADLIPFKKLVPDLQAIMSAHIIFPEVDAQYPATLSHIWITNILREKLGFKGMIFSDCLSMAGVAKLVPDPVQRVQLAFAAGCDMALLCNDRSAVERVVESCVVPENSQLAERIELMRRFKK